MTHTLISFLGRGNPGQGKRYRKTTYDFGPGQQSATEFFGLALTQQLKPDRLMILGTTGSMWDVLLFSLGLDQEYDDALLALTESADRDRTTQKELDNLSPIVSQKLGLPVVLRLIPYGRDLTQQLKILTVIASDFKPGHQASLDVTHGLRHLPMLAQISALYLRSAVGVEIQGIYYGALDMTRNGLTPVMNLNGLLRIADWVAALSKFDKDGDYGAFLALLDDSLPQDTLALLEDAAFYERINRIGQARGKLRDFERTMDQNGGLKAIGRLFEPTLRERIAWCHEDRHYQRQRALAVQHLNWGDYLRAALFAYEAFVTRLIQNQGNNNPENFEVRSQAKEEYENGNADKIQRKRYRLLRDLRNQLAHGNTAPREEVQQAMANAATLRQTLEDLIDQLLPDS